METREPVNKTWKQREPVNKTWKQREPVNKNMETREPVNKKPSLVNCHFVFHYNNIIAYYRRCATPELKILLKKNQ